VPAIAWAPLSNRSPSSTPTGQGWWCRTSMTRLSWQGESSGPALSKLSRSSVLASAWTCESLLGLNERDRWITNIAAGRKAGSVARRHLPQIAGIGLPEPNHFGVPIIGTKARAVSGPTPGCVSVAAPGVTELLKLPSSSFLEASAS
jgi:hypothetical protein